MIYLAAPYSHPDKEIVQARMESIYRVMSTYMKKGEHILTPLFMHEVVLRHNLPDDFVYWGKYCLDLLKRCDKMVVLTLPGWEFSNGVHKEIAFCNENNIPVEYIKPSPL